MILWSLITRNFMASMASSKPHYEDVDALLHPCRHPIESYTAGMRYNIDDEASILWTRRLG